jgi:reverse transcriptase-like protein
MAKRIFSNDFITIADLYLAYRKAKADAFYDNLHPNALSFTEYEQNLRLNLELLHDRLNRSDASWKGDLDFIGGYLYVPKSIDVSAWSGSNDIHYLDVDPIQHWRNQYQANRKKRLDAAYRLLIAPKVDYQIVSALWIIKVGEKYEGRLDADLSYGNRLRRRESRFANFIDGDSGGLNLDCLGLFAPYFSAYKNWRGNGLNAMKVSIQENKNVTAITMDLAGFYHNVGPKFMVRPSFLKQIGLSLTADEKRFTQYLLDSIDTWYESSPDYVKRKEGALPVGLSASKIISNILLYQLDAEVRDNLNPVYYGRYVDDLFLVIETPEGITSGRDVLKSLASRMPSLVVKYVKGKEPDLRLKLPYAVDSNLFFAARKQKIFNLSSDHGLDLVDQISSQIRAQSSEYRLLPELPDNAADMAVGSLLATSNASLSADALRKADVVSIRRMGFSLLLKDVESYSRDLKREEWAATREEFYILVSRHLLSPTSLFELSNYYSRIFKLVVANEDFDFANEFVDQLFDCLSLVEETTTEGSVARLARSKCKEYFARLLLQGSIQASTTRNFSEWRKLGQLLRRTFRRAGVDLQRSTIPFLKRQSQQVLLADWGSRPYKDYWYYDQPKDIRDARIPRSLAVQRVINWLKIKKFTKVAELKTPHWPALTFPTRPLTVQEIGLVAPAVFHDGSLYRDAIRGLRGAKVWSSERVGFYSDEEDLYFYVPEKGKNNIRIALINFKTTRLQWKSAVKGNPDRSIQRYENLSNLVNQVLKEKKRPDYLLFPECSLPRRWAISIAGRLAREGISLIAGLEYYPDRKMRHKLRNDSLVSLATRWPGYRSNIIYTQPKLSPSHEEKYTLKKMGRQQYLPSGGIDEVPIYIHGAYIFGVVNCSDLTTPQNRVRYQGKVDGLYVLEWNPDVKTFSFLVEGTAHDVHTFVVQVNNRMFGDSRVRAPYRKDYQRDLIRVKGGVSDYYVLGDMDYISLRRYQKRNHMAEKTSAFKPVPIGFRMSKYRKRIPKKN